MTEIVPSGPGALVALAADIRREVQAAEADFQSAVAHAIRAGELLIEAKAQVRHGEWMPWLEANCPLGEREARNYMRLARNRQRVADLPTVREAVKQLTEKATTMVPCPACGRTVEVKLAPWFDEDSFEDLRHATAAARRKCPTCNAKDQVQPLATYEVKTERQRQLAEKAKQRLWNVIARSRPVLREGERLVEVLHVERAMAVADVGEVDAMVEQLDASIRELGGLRDELRRRGRQ